MAPSNASVISANPAISLKRLRMMSRKCSETKATTSRLRSEAGIIAPSFVHGDEAMQRLRRCRTILNHSDADVVRARTAAVGLLAREIAAGHDAHAGLLPQPFGHVLAPTIFRLVEPEEKSAGRTLVAVTVADDLVGQI